MSQLDFSGLADLAKRDPAKVKAGWQPPTIEDFGIGKVLAFDQSLTATGWVALSGDGSRLVVVECGKITASTTTEGRGGIEQDLQRGVAVFEAAVMLIDRWHPEAKIAHESPPHPGNVKGGGTSSLMAAQSVRNAAFICAAPVEMLGAQPAKKLICGNTNAKKTEAHAALKVHLLPHIEGGHLITNEAMRDALMVGLLHLHRRK